MVCIVYPIESVSIVYHIEEKIMFGSQDIEIFVFLWNPQISKSVMSS